MHLTKLCKNGNGLFVHIPVAILNHFGWAKGTPIVVFVEDDGLRVKEVDVKKVMQSSRRREKREKVPVG